MKNTMMKKIAVAFAAATMALTAVSATAFANDGMGISTMDVTTQDMDAMKFVIAKSGANVRTAPTTDNTKGRILKSLDYNTQIHVTGKTSNGWYVIITTDPVYGGETAGYIAGDLLSDSKGADIVVNNNTGVNQKYPWIKETNSSNTTREKQQRGEMSHDNDTFTVNVAYGYLALRSSAVTDPSNEIGQLQNGEMVHVQNYGSQFDYVYVPRTGQYGYVNNDYLKA